MSLRITAVDATDEKTAALLKYLQLDTLDGSPLYDTSYGHWWIAYDGELPVAFAGVCQSYRWADTGYLCRAGVIRSHRGQGIQRRLVRVRELKGKRLGWNWLVTDTAPWNMPSANSLIGCGFRMFRPSRPWGIEGALYWRKRISKGKTDGETSMQ
jgi:GNAT superfamily N-acetyltransferase